MRHANKSPTALQPWWDGRSNAASAPSLRPATAGARHGATVPDGALRSQVRQHHCPERAATPATLASLLRQAGDGIRLSEHIDGSDGETVFNQACRTRLEGIVAKRRDRLYRSGRSPDWIKVKNPDAPV